jgi:uncharacterized protein (DUF305 family)
MTVIQESSKNESARRSPVSTVILLTAVALLAAIGGYMLRSLQTPGADSVDVGFARDMSEHHRQAVEMSRLLYDRTDDEIMRSLAYDIMITQQGQIGIMTGYLNAWDHPVTDLGPRMRWMGMNMEGLMPGMATRDQMNALAAADGVEAEIIFLQLMIPHHVSGVDMAQAAADDARTEIVRNLAQGMAEAQDSEIRYMQELLEERGQEPVPVELDTDMDM